jgi:hypothetical protein
LIFNKKGKVGGKTPFEPFTFVKKDGIIIADKTKPTHIGVRSERFVSGRYF